MRLFILSFVSLCFFLNFCLLKKQIKFLTLGVTGQMKMKIASIYRKCIPASFENTFQIFAQQILIKILYNLPHDIYFKYFKKLR